MDRGAAATFGRRVQRLGGPLTFLPFASARSDGVVRAPVSAACVWALRTHLGTLTARSSPRACAAATTSSRAGSRSQTSFFCFFFTERKWEGLGAATGRRGALVRPSSTRQVHSFGTRTPIVAGEPCGLGASASRRPAGTPKHPGKSATPPGRDHQAWPTRAPPCAKKPLRPAARRARPRLPSPPRER